MILHCACRPPPLVRKTRAQLKEEAEEIARLTAAEPVPEPQPEPEQEPDLADDPDAMDALDAFSALAGRHPFVVPAQLCPEPARCDVCSDMQREALAVKLAISLCHELDIWHTRYNSGFTHQDGCMHILALVQPLQALARVQHRTTQAILCRCPCRSVWSNSCCQQPSNCSTSHHAPVVLFSCERTHCTTPYSRKWLCRAGRPC